MILIISTIYTGITKHFTEAHRPFYSKRIPRGTAERGKVYTEVTLLEYKILKELEKNPSHTQRSLAQKLNVSLGKINYLLAGLVEKGIIKAKRLKDEPGAIRWNYILTPQGLKEKAVITREYLKKRTQEFYQIQKEIESLKNEVNSGETQNTTEEK